MAYVRHPSSMVSLGKSDVIAEVDRLVEKHRRAAESMGVEPDLRALYRYFARAHRRAGRTVPASRMYGRVAVAYGSVGDAARAVGVLLGRRAERVKRLLVRRGPEPPPSPEQLAPPWLADYRLGRVDLETSTVAAAGS